MFDGELGITLHPVQWNQASSRGEGKSHGFSLVAAEIWAIFSS